MRKMGQGIAVEPPVCEKNEILCFMPKTTGPARSLFFFNALALRSILMALSKRRNYLRFANCCASIKCMVT